jgi:hypothetical protein
MKLENLVYYSSCNYTANWLLSWQLRNYTNPWRKWRKKNDGLYNGLGSDYLKNKNRNPM